MTREGMPATLAVVMGLYLFGVGIVSGASYGKREADAGGRVERVQAYNDELEHQLTVGGRVVAHLRVDDAAQDFKFQTVNLTGQREQCAGSYKLKNDVATATGKLACTVMTPIH